MKTDDLSIGRQIVSLVGCCSLVGRCFAASQNASDNVTRNALCNAHGRKATQKRELYQNVHLSSPYLL